ncbi:MAG TPA: nuclear transport factor 2 family protein [Vicinamibacterales bacterium]|nr:nuclear transport factor 2 family protein [Vicinamibacterales bacterium]
MPVPGPVSQETAAGLATEWIAAWNAHDLERILSHYAEDFEMRSPLIVERGIDAGGVLRGKPAVRAYWQAALAAAVPPVRFELQGVYAGVGTVAIHYLSVGRRMVIELLELDAEGRIARGHGIYALDPPA